MTTATPAIRARAGAVSVNVVVHRPSWKDMEKNYPGESIESKDFYPMVGKEYVNSVRRDPDNYENTCAARMSYALNRSGLKLPRALKGGDIKGDDGYYYWLRVADLREKLKGQFGAADNMLVHRMLEKKPTEEQLKARVDKAKGFIKDISSKKGIVVFEVTGWNNASGHFTLWNGQDLKYVGPGEHNDPKSYEYYFWLVRWNELEEVKVQGTRVLFWELK